MRSMLAAFSVACLVAGCGSSVEPRAPYDSAAAVPTPRALHARTDVSLGIVVTWSATAADRAIVDGWSIERRKTTETAFTPLLPVSILDTTFVDGSLADGERAVYRVRGVTAAGIASAPVETAPVRTDRIAPVAPTDVQASTATGGIALTFTTGLEPDLAFFEARILPTAPGGGPPLLRTILSSPALLTGLMAGAEYAIEVTAVDSAGRASPPSAPPAIATAGGP